MSDEKLALIKNKGDNMKKTKSKQDLIKASKALYYEIMMLNECAKFSKIFKNIIDLSPFLKNILIESFCVHLRNVIEFFGKQKKDYITYKYFMASDKSVHFPHNLSKKYNNKVNNLLSHLTFTRLSFNLKQKSWVLSQIANEVNENLREFSKNADNNLLCDQLEAYMEGIFGN